MPDQDPVPPPPVPPPTTLRRIFIGADGLRAGWSLAIFCSPFLVLYLIGHYAMTHGLVPAPAKPSSSGAAELSPLMAIFSEGFVFVVLAIASLIMAVIERRPYPRYGLTLQRMLPDFATGLGWGLLSLSLLAGALFFSHHLAFDGLALHGLSALGYAAVWALAFLLVGLFEEFFFRGYLQYTLTRGIAGTIRAVSPGNPNAHLFGFLIAALVLSIGLFSWTHTSNQGENPAGIAAVALAGAVFAFSLYRTGSLWWGIGFHTAWDWAQSYLYGTPDSGERSAGHLLATHPIGSTLFSGGSAGPEGSVLVIPTLLCVALIIHLTLPKRDYPFP